MTRIEQLENENKKLRSALIDLLDGQSVWHEIYLHTGCSKKRCEEISELFDEIVSDGFTERL